MSPGPKLTIIGGLFILVVSFWTTLNYLSPTDPRDDRSTGSLDSVDACLKGERVPLNAPFAPLEGYAYKASLPSLASISDTDKNPARSPAILCENDTVLGPRHAPWAEITRAGYGRFSHYGDVVVFSSSDNSNPNSNGRQYTVVIPRK